MANLVQLPPGAATPDQHLSSLHLHTVAIIRPGGHNVPLRRQKAFGSFRQADKIKTALLKDFADSLTRRRTWRPPSGIPNRNA